MKRLSLILLLSFIASSPLLSQSNNTLLVLNKYTIPTETKGAQIGRIISPVKQKISIVKDTAKIFDIDKQGNIRLKKNISLSRKSPIRYGITIQCGKEKKDFELVKDNFIRNKVIAHRGAWKNQDASQNSLKALKKAIELGCEGSEFDVWLSSDNKVVLSHDPKIGGKVVEETSAEELYKIELKDGDHLPNLEEYINCIKGQNKTRLILEVKTSEKGIERSEAVAEASVRKVHEMKAQAWTDYITFSFEAALKIRELDPTATILYLEANKTLEEIKAAKLNGIDLHFSHFLKNTNLRDKANAMKLLTNAWTVNKEEDLKTMIDQGIDYITTDEPELLLRLLEK